MSNAYDKYGRKLEEGDTVRCHHRGYKTYACGEVTTILGTEGRCIILHNDYSDTSTGRYIAENFVLVEKHIKIEKEPIMAKSMLYVAILKTNGAVSSEEMMKEINSSSPLDIISDTSFERLKDKVQARINSDPTEVWISGIFGSEIRTRQTPITVMDW